MPVILQSLLYPHWIQFNFDRSTSTPFVLFLAAKFVSTKRMFLPVNLQALLYSTESAGTLHAGQADTFRHLLFWF